ncbi:lipopolysaccharide kinase InaA family protein [Sulfurimonas microaerophilic]|uniref:lipopolysaccharide kinase InaA family protein n=1 Tax=Sulfurimonas microaerophilic TaxID=3058392 RepID=UPI002715269A|nr:lipopolysaccharide kinase InaA family protein [Sulfurimonas sp. hsl 1-7]
MHKYILNKKNEEFSDFILNIRTFFSKNTESIHKARNELKIINYKDTNVVVKSFKVPNLVRRFIYTFLRDSKAKKSYDNSLKIGSFTPEPIGYIEFYKNFLLADSYFIAKKFDYDFTIKEPIVNQDFPNREKIFQELAQFTFQLHQNNIFHKDFSPGNILIKQEEEKYIFKIVDINRMTFKRLSIQERFKNFSKLWMRDKDMEIIAKEYAKLLKEDETKCIDLAIDYSRALKRKINMKKRLKGIEVVD